MQIDPPESISTINPYLQYYPVELLPVLEDIWKLSVAKQECVRDYTRRNRCEQLSKVDSLLSKRLFEERGVANLTRYSVSDLERSMEIANPNIVHLTAYYDPKRVDIVQSFDSIATGLDLKNYFWSQNMLDNAWFFECGDPQKAFDYISMATRDYPQIFIIHAHGNGKSIALGDPNSDGKLSQEWLRSSSEYLELADNSCIVLDGCLLGVSNGLALELSRKTNAVVIGSNIPTSGYGIRTDEIGALTIPRVGYSPAGSRGLLRAGYVPPRSLGKRLFDMPVTRMYANGYEL